jgi:hypothetical protein
LIPKSGLPCEILRLLEQEFQEARLDDW